MKRRIIAPSILSADFMRLKEEIESVCRAGADWLHIDVMDGHFVDNMTIGAMVVEQIRKVSDITLDVHLMIENPDMWVDRYIEAGADNVTVHVEACRHLHRTIHRIKDKGKMASVSLNPATPPQLLECILGDIDMVLVMSVNPGFGGQRYIPSVERKIEYLNELRKAEGYGYLIEVDGGVNDKNAGKLISIGVDVLVAGSFIFKSGNYKEAIDKLRRV